jgi:hypothetical protein
MANYRQNETAADDGSIPLLPLYRLAKAIGIPEATARRMVARKVLLPDFKAGRMSLFDPARVEAIKRKIHQ